METAEMYKSIVNGESFNDVPQETMRELRDAVDTFRIAHRLPKYNWEQIKHNNIS